MLSVMMIMAGLAQAQGGPFVPARPGPFGIGVILGPTTGVSGAWRPSAWSAVQSAIGWDMRSSRLDVSADYLQSIRVLEPTSGTRMPVYVGIGGGVVTAEPGMFGDNAGVSARVPIGASLFVEQFPIELFAQVVPHLRLIPDTGFGVDAGIGGRFYF